MNSPRTITRYNQPIPYMRARASSGPRLGWLTSFSLAMVFLPSSLHASSFAETALQLAHKIAAATGPGAFVLEVTNHSSLDDKSVREVRSTLEAALQAEGVHPAKAEQSMGTVEVVLSESLREYVWTAQIAIGSDEKRVAMVSLSRPPSGTPFAATLPLVVKKTFLFAHEQAILDAAVVDTPGGSRLIVLGSSTVTIYRRQGLDSSGRWDLEASLPITHARAFPRDLRGRLLLRRDHLFDVYLPGTSCRSSAVAPLTLTCSESSDASRDSLWPLTSTDDGVQAHFAAARNFFTGSLSPGIGKLSTVPPFYSAAELPRSNYTLWALTSTDGSLHLVDGMTDQLIRGITWGSEIAAIHSGCGSGAQLLVSESGSPERGTLRVFEIPDRGPVAASPAVEFDGQITALWSETNVNNAIAVIRKNDRRNDPGRYEAYRVSISCSN
jgi:hypothetical protein